MDHGTAFGRIAFSCAKAEVTAASPFPLALPGAGAGRVISRVSKASPP